MTASQDGITSNTVAVTVTAAELDTIAVTPATVSLAGVRTEQLTVRATVTQKAEAATPDTLAAAMLKCTIAVIDDQNNVQTDGVGDPMDKVYVTTKTLQTDAGEAVQIADEVADLLAGCIVEVANRLAVHSSIAAMAIPGG